MNKRACPSWLRLGGSRILSGWTLIWALPLLAGAGSSSESLASRRMEALVHSREVRSDEITRAIRPKLMASGPTRGGRIALTFDDGPNPEITPRILAILKKYNAHATFFMIGARVRTDPGVARQVLATGNEIGNHTQNHVNLTTVSTEQLFSEFEEATQAIEEEVGISPSVCRPPGGRYNESVLDAATTFGMTTVLWTANPADFNLGSPNQIAKDVLKAAKPGGIILLHDSVEETVKALPLILEGLRKRGMRAVTAGSLAGLPD